MANILIIGASSGIGKQLAEQLIDENHTVFGTYNSHNENLNPNIEYHHCDVRSENIDFSFLPEVLDGFVYCPGNIVLKPFHRIKMEEFNQDYQVQVIGFVKILQSVLPNLKASQHASVVVFSTIAVQTGLGFHSMISASKGALEGMSRSLAAELAPKIRVNCIAPSLTNTPLASNLLNTEDKVRQNAERHPLKRIGEAEDIANLCSFLLSEKSSWITGQVHHIDGGMSSLR
jgi:NAD(P)-dependent dehydrogenase (short-subunit alcohol dehydrogenase family)